VASLWNLPLLRLDVGKIFSGIVGSSEQNVRRAIQVAESVAPVILWMDEMEKGFAGVQSSPFSDAGTTSRVFGTFVTWLQEKTAPVFIVATANDVSQLPPELLRKGRFDEIFFVDLPDEPERADIFRIHLAKRKRDPKNYDIATLAAVSEGFSGAEIEQVIISALFDAFAQGAELTDEYILRAIKESVPISVTMAEHIAGLRLWAEKRARPAS
jgi:SpoVK/Ycf46/Vps4 family AAA+-type ATPase